MSRWIAGSANHSRKRALRSRLEQSALASPWLATMGKPNPFHSSTTGLSARSQRMTQLILGRSLATCSNQARVPGTRPSTTTASADCHSRLTGPTRTSDACRQSQPGCRQPISRLIWPNHKGSTSTKRMRHGVESAFSGGLFRWVAFMAGFDRFIATQFSGPAAKPVLRRLNDSGLTVVQSPAARKQRRRRVQGAKHLKANPAPAIDTA